MDGGFYSLESPSQRPRNKQLLLHRKLEFLFQLNFFQFLVVKILDLDPDPRFTEEPRSRSSESGSETLDTVIGMVYETQAPYVGVFILLLQKDRF
jgi:hypothetical protein